MKRIKRWSKMITILLFVILLSACTQQGVDQQSAGLWNGVFIYNLSRFILWLSHLFNNNYAIGIILFTIIIRLILWPLNSMQIKSQRKMMEIQPELEKIKAKYPNRDRQSMELMQQEQQAFMEENGINQFAGFLPLIIQLPVMMGLYQAIFKTQELRQGTFLWAHLGQPDSLFILPLIAAGLTFANTYLTTLSNPVKNSTTTVMMYVMPIMILLISFRLPAAVTLYWVITNLISVIQTLLLNNPYKILEERRLKEESEREKQRRLQKALRRATK